MNLDELLSAVKFKYKINNLAQPITKQCLTLFSLWRKKVASAIKKKNT